MEITKSAIGDEILREYSKEKEIVRCFKDMSQFETWLLEKLIKEKMNKSTTEILEEMKNESDLEPFEEKAYHKSIMDKGVKEAAIAVFGKDKVEDLEFDDDNKNQKELYEDYHLILTLRRDSKFTL